MVGPSESQRAKASEKVSVSEMQASTPEAQVSEAQIAQAELQTTHSESTSQKNQPVGLLAATKQGRFDWRVLRTWKRFPL